ncbi:FAD/NAD(P)-binding domain-containing protein [Aspergillus uvarum CBS 121591]|uniref:FAD/NAD(P)-binding domain-containing protein n=1 Tax=Aspergillus uvarum CBS 121591 TaxID=1448315 RepID=A0A319CDX3_9EURO|nr:FAD/NAD(P)-binding domain-containing protein [Aspergillus uvarum CBS 121591]PYH82660.1 FAD/NAD(P)-binding domain-containing protein [Aspergillus uvarum CBS 121591]
MVSLQWRPGRRVAIVGGGPGSISAGLAFLARGFDVRIYERQPECKAIGGAVLLSTPVLSILRAYGLSLEHFGGHTVTYFKNKAGGERVKLPFNPTVEQRMGIKGWHYGVLRSSIFQRMLELVPAGVIHADHEFTAYRETADEIELHFANGQRVTADLLVGADGIRSRVSRQTFGDPRLFHTGIRLWLAWCDFIPDIPPHYGYVSHDWQHQASFFPMVHDGKPGFEWWVVEHSYEGKPVPANPKEHLTAILKDWAQPMPRFLEATDFDTQVYRWEIYNRPSMKKWSQGRVVCLGDAVHPVSPYAAYGMGMAIEDGYFLARALDGVDLRDVRACTAAFEIYEAQRVDYVNHNMEFARFLGRMFHGLPRPLAYVRDLVFDYTPFLKRFLGEGYLKKAEKETLGLRELQVASV